MTVAATGKFSLRLDQLRNLFAASDTFQTWTGTASALAAKDRTYVGWFPKGSSFPLLTVDHFNRIAEKATSSFKFDIRDYRLGALLVAEAAELDEGEDYQDEIYSFLNTISAIDDEIQAEIASDPGAYPALKGFEGPDLGYPDPTNTDGGLRLYEALYVFDLQGHT